MRRLLLLLLSASACAKAPPPIAEEPPPAIEVSPSAAPIASSIADVPNPGGASRDAPRTPIVRETQEVIVDGVKEQWRLEWITVPERACFDDQWATCPCYGFAFGESGDFDLVRERPGTPPERLHLSGILQRWPVLDTDTQRRITGNVDADEITRRPEVKLIHLGDYDHDGRATEFVLQVGAGSPCTRTWSEIVGIDRRTGKLHAFGTAAYPDKPLVLEYRREWEDVKKSLVTEVTEMGCGDHGSDTMVTDLVRVTPRGFDVEVRTYDCIWMHDPSVPARRGKLLDRKPWGSEGTFTF